MPALFRDTVLRRGFPCLGARSSVRRGQCRVRVYPELGTVRDATSVCADLYEFARDTTYPGNFASFTAMFTGPPIGSESEFERLLWAHLQLMHDIDAPRYGWDPDTAGDPRDPRFSFSIGGHAYYIVGMHGAASRFARRFPYPTIVFNPHAQFVWLREQGLLDTFKRLIRTRDIRLQGSVNPALLNPASGSQACQYSGRPVEPHWHCPFQPHPDRPPAPAVRTSRA
ncbi:guanitoxin biosynthesis heme-dependent pre-guanitoxin N-hydroxylase GntA [Nocardia aurantia]|uniref:YqcI/YcgG family protein n=1 Tax=Nocardia aurantia TaxID=2585199 RepID=A0A7K0DX64_9NOCA|nr:guanitoxin biosynthesis heme-dependent pre-guanitoxin N-hydroxylase GntA [Nocardia aurantia]MQY30369.1 hypothetical protein [Nocardia aurantia]